MTASGATGDAERANPYGPPSAAVADRVGRDGETDLAGRGERLAAVMIDALIGAVIVLPLMVLGGYFQEVWQAAEAGRRVDFAMQAGWGALGMVLFALLQGYPLKRWAQTWGKRAVGIRIVSLDGRQPGLARLLLRRYLPTQVAALVPFLGNVLAIADTLLIFRGDRRCGHDLIAGTRVVKADTGLARGARPASDQASAARSAASAEASASGA